MVVCEKKIQDVICSCLIHVSDFNLLFKIRGVTYIYIQGPSSKGSLFLVFYRDRHFTNFGIIFSHLNRSVFRS